MIEMMRTFCSWTTSDAPLAVASVDAAALLAILTPVVVVPTGVITFYLRGLREQIAAVRDELMRRIESHDSLLHTTEARCVAVERDCAAVQRDCAAKEDWLRECMLARRNIERLAESVARLDERLAVSMRNVSTNTTVAPADRRRDQYCEGTD